MGGLPVAVNKAQKPGWIRARLANWKTEYGMGAADGIPVRLALSSQRAAARDSS